MQKSPAERLYLELSSTFSENEITWSNCAIVHEFSKLVSAHSSTYGEGVNLGT